MPKEKKSACSAILSAIRAARGTSIMVPIRISRPTPSSFRTRSTTAETISRRRTISASVPTRGTMISGRTSSPALVRTQAARTIASTCIS